MGLFGKKNEADGEDSNRLALFGGRSKSKSPAPPANPYAQPQAGGNPYAQAPAVSDPYGQAKAKAYSNPAAPPPSTSDSRYGGNKSSGYSDNKYGTSSSNEKFADGGDQYGAKSGGYSANRYGNQAGYGGDRHGTTPSSRYGVGGYGGLGGDSFVPQQDEEARSALFGGASERVQQREQPRGGYGAPPPPYDDGAQQGGGNGGSSQDYAPYQDRQLTAEEEEDADVTATKQQIRSLKREDVSSTRNALRAAQQAEEVGRDTLARYLAP